MFYGVATKVATKSDIDSLKTTMSPRLDAYDARIRALELQMASHFGASPTTYQPSSVIDGLSEDGARLLLAQYAPSPRQIPPPPVGQYPPVGQGAPAPVPIAPNASAQAQASAFRTVVVPKEFIGGYQMVPARGGTYILFGEDGRYYSLDDFLAIMGRIVLEHVRLLGRK